VLQSWAEDEQVAAVLVALDLRHRAWMWHLPPQHGSPPGLLLDRVVQVLSWTPRPRLARDVVCSALAAHAVETINGAAERPGLWQLLGADVAPGDTVPEQVADLVGTAVRHGLVPLVNVAVTAMTHLPRTATLARLRVAAAGRTEPLLDRVGRMVLRDVGPRDARRLVDEVQKVATQDPEQVGFWSDKWWRKVLAPETADAVFASRYSW
jgi:hypothetical protein